MKTTKLDKNVILETIQKEADAYVRKMNIYEEVKKLNAELKNLYENGPMITSFGFKSDNDALSVNKTGFANPQNLSYIAQLEKEMEESNENTLNEVEVLKQENEVLRKELEELKASKKEA
jgi:hypothetical protein